MHSVLIIQIYYVLNLKRYRQIIVKLGVEKIPQLSTPNTPLPHGFAVEKSQEIALFGIWVGIDVGLLRMSE